MTHMTNLTRFFFALAMVFTLAGVANTASAITLDEARVQGLVGERPDGLVGAVSSNASTDIAAMIAEINAARLESYRRLSSKDNAPVAAVQAIAGEKLMAKARENGWYVMNSNGSWSR